MANAQQDVVDMTPMSVTEESSDDDQQTVSGETEGMSKDDKKDLDLVKTPFSTKSSINDTALVVEGEKLFVSKPVLGLVSPVFRAMFESDMMEKNMDEIPLPGKRLSDMIEFLLCVYPDTQNTITEDNAEVLVPLFTEYQMDNLRTACERILAESCTEDTDINTLFKHLLLSVTYNMGFLRGRCIQLASTRNTDILREAGREYALPSDVTSELWESVTKRRDSEILSLINMNIMIYKQPGILSTKSKSKSTGFTFGQQAVFKDLNQIKPTRYICPQYITAIQTASDYKLINAENTLLKVFVDEMNNTEEFDIIMMSELPQNIKEKLSKKYRRVLLIE